MTPAGFLGWLPLLLGVFGFQPGAIQSVTRIVIQDEVILRVPIAPRPVVPQVQWMEQKNAKCIPINDIRSALLSGAQQVDFVMADRGRVRAHLDEDCPALDFYGGFYLQPRDNRLCAGRDEIHSRMGGDCAIESLKKLVPVVRR